MGPQSRRCLPQYEAWAEITLLALVGTGGHWWCAVPPACRLLAAPGGECFVSQCERAGPSLLQHGRITGRQKRGEMAMHAEHEGRIAHKRG
jgi:hypothetical protein